MKREMTSTERVNKTLRHQIPDRVPVALHNFLAVGPFIGCHDLGALVQSGELMAQAQIACWRQVGHDVLQLENGVAALAQALGTQVRYSPTEPPHVATPLLAELRDWTRLSVPDPERTYPLSENLKATRIVARELGNEVFICGRADQGPLALAAALRGVENLLLDLMAAQEDPGTERALQGFLNFCTDCSIRYAQAQGQAGAHGTCIGGYGVSTISPALYRKYEQPLEAHWVQAVRAAGLVPFLHLCGNETVILDDIIHTGAGVLELDPSTDMQQARVKAQGKTVLLGFIDPVNVLGQGTPEQVTDKCQETIRILASGGGFILAPGCALPVGTPAKNMKAMVEAAGRFGRYAPK